jgi:WD40 repeat protein
VWTLADGKEVLALPHPGAVTGLSFNSDRSRLTTACADGRVRIWDTAAKLEVQGFLHQGAVQAALFHPANNALVISAGADKAVQVHTATNARVVPVGGPVRGLAVNQPGNQVWTAGTDGKAKAWNTASGALERTFDAGDKPLGSVAVARNGLLVATGGADGKVRVFGVNENKLLSLLTPPKEPRSLTFSADNQALVASCTDGSLVIWNVIHAPGQPLPAEFGKVLQMYNHASAELVFPPVGSIFYSVGADKTARAWKLVSDSPTRTFATPNVVTSVAFNPAGTQVASACGDGKVRVHELAKGTLLKEINAHPTANQQATYCVAWSPDGALLASGGIDQTIRLLSPAGGTVVRTFLAYNDKTFPKGHQEAVLSVAFSPDGKQIASGGMDKAIKIWNVADGSVVRELVNPAFKTAAHPGWVNALHWTKDGRLISAGAAPGLKGYLAIWDGASGKLLHGEELAVGTVFSLAVSPDGTKVALGTGGSIRVGPELNQGVVLKMPGAK